MKRLYFVPVIIWHFVILGMLCMNFYPPPRGDAVHHNFVIIWGHFYSLQLIFGEQGEDIKIAVEVESLTETMEQVITIVY